MSDEKDFKRVADIIVEAINLAVKNSDHLTAKHLGAALESSMLFKTGGEGFVEKRDVDPGVEKALLNLRSMEDIDDHLF